VKFTIYLDESSSQTLYLCAGWAARPENWPRIEDNWREALEAKPALRYFKLNDALGLKGAFEGWDEESRDAKLKALIRILPHDGTVFGAGCYISRDTFDKERSKIRRKIFRDPYYFCVATTMVLSASSETQIVGAESIDFVLDHSREAERMQRLFYDSIKLKLPKLGECLTQDDKLTPQLQAADLAVGATRQLYEPCPRAIPGITLLNGIFTGVFEINPTGLQQILATPVFENDGQAEA
jgi:hypothetical protein